MGQITKEMVEARKASLLADLSAVSGALQDCDYWLEVLDDEDEPDEEITTEEGA